MGRYCSITRSRHALAVGVTSVAAICLLLASCTAQPEGSGHLAAFDEAELTEKVPLVVEGAILSEEVVKLRDDPSLPPDWEFRRELRELVNGGAARRKWEIKITVWIKGTSTEKVLAFRPAGQRGRLWGVWSEAEMEGLPDLGTGGAFRFWLEQDQYLPNNYFMNAAIEL